MNGCLAPSEIVIVHARQIVVYANNRDRPDRLARRDGPVLVQPDSGRWRRSHGRTACLRPPGVRIASNKRRAIAGADQYAKNRFDLCADTGRLGASSAPGNSGLTRRRLTPCASGYRSRSLDRACAALTAPAMSASVLRRVGIARSILGALPLLERARSARLG